MEERLLTLTDGRSLRVVDNGCDGPPVVFHHGTPGTAGTGVGLAARIGGMVRIVSYDRAGYGASTARPGRAVADVAADIAELADAVGLDRFATWGWSGGAPHALATAALLGDRVTRCAVWGAPLPPDNGSVGFMDGMAAGNIAEFSLAVAGREALEPVVAESAARRAAMTPAEAVEDLAPFCSPPDLAALRRTVDVVIEPVLGDLGRPHAGWVDDDLAFVKPWGFDPASIRVPVAIWHGPHDLMVPIAHGQWLAANVRGATLHGSDGDGHITLIETALDETVAWLSQS